MNNNQLNIRLTIKLIPMKNLFILFILIAPILHLNTWAQATENQPKKAEKEIMFFESESKYDFDETVKLLQSEIEKAKWKLVSVNDLQQTLKAAGKDVLPVKVFSLCHPKHSGKILEKDNERIISCMMPCRISVYKKSDGKTYLSRLNPAPMAKTYGGVIDLVMTDSASDIEIIIGPIILKQ